MVSLSFLKLLENNGFGVIDESLFWEKMGLNEDGVYISDIGAERYRGSRPSYNFELYSRAKNDVQAYKQLQAIYEFLNRSFAICELPAVPPVTDYGYGNVTIMPPSAISNVGLDENGRTVYSLNVQVYVGEKIQSEPPVEGGFVLSEDKKKLQTENNESILTEKK